MEQTLEELVAQFVVRREEGENLTPVQFAKEHPQLGPVLLQALERLAKTEGLFPRHDGELPHTVGPYRVLGLLGSGGMGNVLRVEHRERPGTELALKLLHLSSRLNPRAAERFEREVEILRGIEHPGIVRLRDVGRAGAETYFVMDLVLGRSLSELLAAARDRSSKAGTRGSSALLELAGSEDGPRKAAQLILQVARAVATLHEESCVHRDLKPSNILLADRGDPVLIDFGLAGAEDASTLTRTGDVIGTPHYMSPEQARGDRVDERADVWALGVIFYELLTLRPPHGGHDAVSVLHAIRTQPIPSARRFDPSLAKPLIHILEVALAQRAERRYADAGELADDLEAFLEGRPVTARWGFLDRARDTWRWHRPWLIGAAAVVAFSVAWGLGYGGVTPQRDRESRTPVEDREKALRRAIDRATMSWAIDDSDGMRTASQEILQLDPDNTTGEFLLSFAEGSVLIDSADPAVEALIRGYRAEQDADPSSARSHYRRAAELSPNSPLPLIMMGQIGDSSGELEQSLVALREACEENPLSAAAARELGLTLHGLERYDEALVELTRARELAPGFLRISLDLAKTLYFLEGPERGLEEVEVAVEAGARDVYLVSYAAFLIGQREFEHAREILFEIQPRNEASAGLHYQLALTYDFEERIIDALPWYQKALECDPEHVEVLKALFHMHSGANRDTCEKCEAAFETDPWVYDPERVEEYGGRLMHLLRGGNLGVMLWIARTAKRVGRTDAIRDALEELLAQDLEPAVESNLKQTLNTIRSDP